MVDESIDYEKVLGTLPSAAQEEIRKYKRPQDQKVRLVSHQMKDFLSGGRPITRTEHGKPVCDGVWFNVSHDGTCVVGIASAKPVGIDVMDTNMWREIAAFHSAFTPYERAFIGEDLQRFYHIWTAKEAFLKMLGTGLRTALESVEIRHGAVYLNGVRQGCALHHEMVDQYQVAICHEN